MADWTPLAEALALLERKYDIRLHQANLTARKGKRGSGSIMENLEAQGSARKVPRGSRQFWEVNDQGVAKLAEIASAAKPGPPPGAQVTLNAHQLAVFVSHLAKHTRPGEVVRDALFEATGLREGVDRIVIPVSPRQPVAIDASGVAGPTVTEQKR